jgi:hypothetical protein
LSDLRRRLQRLESEGGPIEPAAVAGVRREFGLRYGDDSDVDPFAAAGALAPRYGTLASTVGCLRQYLDDGGPTP